MSTFNKVPLICALLLCVTPLAASAGGDADAGAEKATAKNCHTCHGEKGMSISNQFPNLAGQYADYLAQALKQYSDGSRGNAVMGQFVKGLTQQDMLDIAAFYASQPGLKPVPKP